MVSYHHKTQIKAVYRQLHERAASFSKWYLVFTGIIFHHSAKSRLPPPWYQFHLRIKKKAKQKDNDLCLAISKATPPPTHTHFLKGCRGCLVFLISVLNTIEQGLFVHMARLIILSGVFKACLTKIQWYNWAGLRLTITISIRQFHILPSAAATHARHLYIKKKVIFARHTLYVYTHAPVLGVSFVMGLE